jgi:hypothetical protein
MAARRAAARKNDMKYRIIGVDGKTYGPVGLEQIRQWLAQGRVDRRTPVFVDGASDWTFIGLLPELAVELGTAPPGMPAPRISAPARGTNGFATTAFICALLSWGCCCCCCEPFSLLGIIFSIIALVQISSQPEPQSGRALAIIALVLSAASLLASFGLGLLNLTNQPNVTWHIGQF